MALSDEDAQRGQRIKAVRDARKETGKEFAAALEAISGERYDASEVSRLETGNRVATWADILAIAALDPERRGRDWLAWGDDPESGLAGRPDVKPIEPAPPETLTLDNQPAHRLRGPESPTARPKDVRKKERGGSAS